MTTTDITGIIASRATHQQQRTGVEPFFMHDNTRARRYAEWCVAHSSMPAMARLVMRTVLLYTDARMTRPCSASVAKLAARCSLSRYQVQAILRKSSRTGLVAWGGGVTVLPLPLDDDRTVALRQLWARSGKLLDRWARGRLSPPDQTLLRIQKPYLFGDGGDHDAADHDFVSRFAWIRAVVDYAPFARPRTQRRSRMALQKAVAFSVELLMDTDGRPFRWTTLAEVARFAGVRKVRPVRAALRELEQHGWLGVVRRRGGSDGGGLLLYLTAPVSVKDQWARDDTTAAERYGI